MKSNSILLLRQTSVEMNSKLVIVFRCESTEDYLNIPDNNTRFYVVATYAGEFTDICARFFNPQYYAPADQFLQIYKPVSIHKVDVGKLDKTICDLMITVSLKNINWGVECTEEIRLLYMSKFRTAYPYILPYDLTTADAIIAIDKMIPTHVHNNLNLIDAETDLDNGFDITNNIKVTGNTSIVSLLQSAQQSSPKPPSPVGKETILMESCIDGMTFKLINVDTRSTSSTLPPMINPERTETEKKDLQMRHEIANNTILGMALSFVRGNSNDNPATRTYSLLAENRPICTICETKCLFTPCRSVFHKNGTRLY